MKTFFEFLIEATSKPDLNSVFSELNQRMFDATRQLPRVPISFGNTSKGVAGLCQSTFNRSTRTTVPNSVFIKISNIVQDRESLYKVVAHEMIHARLALDNNDERGHGPYFIALANQISKKIGMEIPLNHEFTASDLENVPRKRVAIYIGTKPNGDLTIMLFSENSVQSVLKDVEALARYNIENNRIKSAWFGTIETRLHKFYPVARTMPKSSYILNQADQDRYKADLIARHNQFFHISG